MGIESQMGLNTGTTGTYDGQKATVTSSSAAFVTIELEDGTTKTVSKTSPLFDFGPDPEVLAYYDEQAEHYHNLKTQARAEEKGFLAQLRSYCNNWGVRFTHQMNAEQKEQYESVKSQYYDAGMSATAASNRERSALIDKFIYIT